MTKMHIAFIACALLVGCSTIEVQTDWDREVDFSRFESFALLEDSDPSINRLIDGRIRAALVEELTSKGLRQLETAEGADLAIGFRVATQNRRSYQTVSSGWRAYGRCTRPRDLREKEQGPRLGGVGQPEARFIRWARAERTADPRCGSANLARLSTRPARRVGAGEDRIE